MCRGVLKGKAISDASSTAQAYKAPRYDSKSYPYALEGAEETSGQILTYKDRPIAAVYSASNGGRIASAAERWGSNYAYLIAKDDPWDAAGGSGKSGHGVGMSQRGAKWAANHGISYREILAFYYPGTEISMEYGQVKSVVNKTAESIIETARSLIGSPYVWGATGELCTVSNRKRRMASPKISTQYKENIINRCPILKGSQKNCTGCKYEGLHEYDCIGFVNNVLSSCGINLYGAGATTHWSTKSNFAQYGGIANMPDLVCCVYKHDGSRMTHIGLHVGGGEIVHCSGEVKTGKTTDKGWTHYAIPKGLYDAEENNHAGKVIPMTVLKLGSTGSAVQALQEMLNKLGYDCGTADGLFGVKTELAVRRFQADKGLTVDGKAGEATLDELAVSAAVVNNDIPAINDPASEATDTITINISKEQYKLLCSVHDLLSKVLGV